MTRVHIKSGKPYDVYCGRPSKWGNPFSHKPSSIAEHKVATREEAIAKHREVVLSSPTLQAAIRAELRGKVLACWCWDTQACHCDTLLEIANSCEC